MNRLSILFLLLCFHSSAQITLKSETVTTMLDVIDSCELQQMSYMSKINFQDSVMSKQKMINDSLKIRVYNLETESYDKSFALDEAATDRFIALKEKKSTKRTNTFWHAFKGALIVILTIVAVK